MRHSNRTYRVVFVTKYEAHHYKPDWECKRPALRGWHYIEFKTMRNADRYLRLLKLIARTGIIGAAFIFERLHSDAVSFKEV